MSPNPKETADLVTLTEEILNGKLHFLCSAVFTFSVFSRKYPFWVNLVQKVKNVSLS